ncbi:MAG TPA: acyltransferase, partial [Methylobacter sp.]
MIWSGWPGLGLPIFPSPGIAAKLAVDLFMILSGFLMALNAHERSAKEPISRLSSWVRFYIRRIFRISPAYYISLIVAVLLAEYFLHGYQLLADRIPGLNDSIYNGKNITYTAENIWMHVTFVFGLLPAWAFSTQLPDWSLSLEMQFYLVFPALSFLIARFGALKIFAILVPICMFATAQLRSIFPEPSFLLFKLPVFCAGMLLCYATIVSSYSERLVLRLVALALTLTQIQFYGKGAVWVTLAASSIALITVERRSHDIFYVLQKKCIGLLDNRIMQFGSDISYSVYLFHGFFIAIVGSALFRNQTFSTLNPHLRTVIFFVTVLIGTLVVSTLVHRVIEMPGIKAGRRVISRLGSARLEKRVASA